MNKVLEVIPAWLMHGFEVMGGILPALLRLNNYGNWQEKFDSLFFNWFCCSSIFWRRSYGRRYFRNLYCLLVRNKALSEEAA